MEKHVYKDYVFLMRYQNTKVLNLEGLQLLIERLSYTVLVINNKLEMCNFLVNRKATIKTAGCGNDSQKPSCSHHFFNSFLSTS
uniref:Uncharacterized protein n=1 Tax=Arundo donax TaxID=35708 RepID=A0A0A9DU68_ARUDO